MIRELTHDLFNEEIYRWTQGIKEGRRYLIKNIKMDKDKFLDSINYLTACGEPVFVSPEKDYIYKDSKYALKPTFKETVQLWDAVKEQNSRVASIQSRGETLYSKRVKDLSEGINSLKSPIINPNNKFQNKLI